MDQFKIQAAVVAEITVTMADGQSFVAANLTVKFVGSISIAKHYVEQMIDDLKWHKKNDHTAYIMGVVDTLKATVAQGCKVEVFVSAFPVRIKPKEPGIWK